jgi:hypothetical protein
LIAAELMITNEFGKDCSLAILLAFHLLMWLFWALEPWVNLAKTALGWEQA